MRQWVSQSEQGRLTAVASSRSIMVYQVPEQFQPVSFPPNGHCSHLQDHLREIMSCGGRNPGPALTKNKRPSISKAKHSKAKEKFRLMGENMREHKDSLEARAPQKSQSCVCRTTKSSWSAWEGVDRTVPSKNFLQKHVTFLLSFFAQFPAQTCLDKMCGQGPVAVVVIVTAMAASGCVGCFGTVPPVKQILHMDARGIM